MSFIDIPAARDKFPLVGTLFDAPAGAGPTSPAKVCILANATGISQAFYADFARHLASQGYTTLTFDYRYTGLSFFSAADGGMQTKALSQDAKIAILKRNPDVSLVTWGERDIAGVIQYASERFRGSKLYFIGHSLGCHVLPLVHPEILTKLSKILFVSATSPHPEASLKPEMMRAVWKQMRGFADEHGYFDGRTWSMGGLLPAQAMFQWADWVEFVHYAADDPKYRKQYKSFSNPVTAFGFLDDMQVMMDPKTLEVWCEGLTGAPTVLYKFDTQAMGYQVGHNDAFRAKNKGFWDQSFMPWLRDEPIVGLAPIMFEHTSQL